MSTAATLPGNCTSPVLPFLGLVINLNVNTKGHRDPWDKDFCLVMPIGDFQGGALALKESGLVLELTSGDFTMFHSADLTHFNLHYMGRRASIILHSDGAMAEWVNNRNGWGGNTYMKTL